MKNHSIKYSSLLITPVTSLSPTGSATVQIFFGLGLPLVFIYSLRIQRKGKNEIENERQTWNACRLSGS